MATVLALRRAKWAPSWDEAIIAWRSWDVLHGHAPLVGQYTQASVVAGKPVFDPGPLLYWVLAVPTSVDPNVGPVVGTALLSIVSLMAACVATARTSRPAFAALVAAAALLLQWNLALQLAGRPVWNPYSVFVPFVALIAVGWVVASGHLGWWPLVVLLASITAQTHLMFAAASLLIAVAAPVSGLVASRRTGRGSSRWSLLAGIIVGLVCWLPALWQEISSPAGNLRLLWRSTIDTKSPTLGVAQGLRRLGEAVDPIRPAWLQSPRPLGAAPDGTALGSVFVGVVVLVIVAAAMIAAFRRARHRLAGLALVALCADLGGVAVVSGVTRTAASTESYVSLVLRPAGLLTFLTVVWVTVAALVGLWRRDPLTAGRSFSLAWRLLPTLSLVIAGLTLAGWQDARAASWAGVNPGSQTREVLTTARQVATLVGPARRPSPRLCVPLPALGGLVTFALAPTIDYQLRLRGWTPTVSTWSQYLAAVYAARDTDPVLVLESAGTAVHGRLLGTVSLPGGGRGQLVLQPPRRTAAISRP